MQTDGHGSAAKRQRTTEFDHPLFLRWLRLLLVSFYKDEELVIADFLGQHAALVKDTVIAHILGLQERQLRQVVERRLVPDCLVEQKVDGTTSKTTYRISPMAIVMTGKRLQTMEDGLSAESGEGYSCAKCNSFYTPLQAMALQDRTADSGSLNFVCKACNEELDFISKSSNSKQDALRRFRLQCRDLLLLTRDLQDMPIPEFTWSKNVGCSLVINPKPLQAAPQLVDTSSSEGGKQDVKLLNTSWFCREVLDEAPRAKPGHISGQAAMITDAIRDAELEEAVAKAEARLREELREDLRDPRRWARPDLRGAASSAKVSCSVRGQVHSVQQVADDHELQERMTDEEYQIFMNIYRETS